MSPTNEVCPGLPAPPHRGSARPRCKLRRDLVPIPLPIIVQRVNQSLRGWACYFDYGNSTQVFGDVRRHVEERLRTHLRKRRQVKARRVGHGRFSNRVLNERCSLFKLSHDSSLEESACVGMKNIGKPYARFDEREWVMVSLDWLVRHRQTKEAETDRPVPDAAGAYSLLYPFA